MKARKEWKCDNCTLVINIGEDYQKEEYKRNGFYCPIIEDYVGPKKEVFRYHADGEVCKQNIQTILEEFIR
jgi:hypothetical protein